MSLANRQYQYIIISLDLATARTDVAQGLTSKINVLAIITLDTGVLNIKLNNSTNTIIPLITGLVIDTIQISEIYWTNTAQPGKTAKIFIVWAD